jgi:hypothetical protein
VRSAHPVAGFPATGQPLRALGLLPAVGRCLRSRPPAASTEARLWCPRLTVRGGLGQGQDDERFAGHGADVVVQAHHLDAGDLLDQLAGVQERLRRS